MNPKSDDATVDSPEGQPPSFTVNIKPPPSYHSVGRPSLAQQETYRNCSKMLLSTVISDYLACTVGCTIVSIVVLTVLVSMVIMGVLYVEQCPRQPNIPIYLIVGGVVGIIKYFVTIWKREKSRIVAEDGDGVPTSVSNKFDGILFCFLVPWVIAGCLWIYNIYSDFNSLDSSDSKYCNPTLYWFAFWVSTATYAIFSLTGACYTCCTGLCFIKQMTDDSDK
ncbi:hypothetical protein LSAT2_024551 [Lamellibrachia satsuma]|nr:hypothetical protein LSAT2_024551 [Lamellibrachia satsuma]